MRALALTVLFGCIAVAPAANAAAVRTADQRAALTRLAFLLGQAHALHRVCAGPADDTWRGWMGRLLEQEDEGFRPRLTESFNAGFASDGGKAASCAAASAMEARVTAAAARLSAPFGAANS